MTNFQMLMMIASVVIFYMLFKQIFSGNHPKRGVDFEAKTPDAQVGGISDPQKIFSKPEVPQSRLDQLLQTADDAVQSGDFKEAKKALGTAQILDEDNTQILYKLAFVNSKLEDHEIARDYLEKLIDLDESDDMAHAMFANTLSILGDSDKAIEHHKKSIELDEEYAPHYFNYANTLHDLSRNSEALEQYKKAYELDPELVEAKQMITKLEE